MRVGGGGGLAILEASSPVQRETERMVTWPGFQFCNKLWSSKQTSTSLALSFLIRNMRILSWIIARSFLALNSKISKCTKKL